ncbi:Centromere/kinetochore protein zw10-like protein [Rhynchospora pubera]|uniref:Centromere/kinetochore protein zw10-like protein n=1 Tax=Rhynchospora pubera TaxID=906938 RepID=A0AAV8CIM3_9POAL|nr:Centromere/kinetochore protein zw10-like protein [Rhynchospora pubera]
MEMGTANLDVRDLLSTAGELDPSSPLSAPDLRLLIDRLQIHSSRIKARARSYLLSHRDDLASAISRAATASSASSSLSDFLSTALQLLSDRPLDLEIRALADQIVATRRELQERKEALGIVTEISRFLDRIRFVREGTRSGRVVEAAKTVCELKNSFFVDKKADEEPLVFDMLRNEWRECFDELQGVLAKNVEDCVRYNEEKRKLVVSSCGDKVELSVALQALEIIDALDYGMAKVADLMIKHVITPVIADISISFTEVVSEDATEKREYALQVVLSESEEYSNGSVLYSRIINILNFINKSICLKKDAWIQCFAKMTWSTITDLIITNFLSKAIPDVPSKLIDFQDIMRNTAEFEEDLRKMHFISDDNKDKKLSQYVDNVEVHFASKKRNELLVKARSILKGFSYADPPESGRSDYLVDILLQQDRCLVSKSAFQLLNLVHEALRDACLSSARVAKEYYNASRDVLHMYMAIIPVKLEKQLSSITQVAIIVHNDLYYMSQEVLGLAFQYRADFPSGLQDHATFVDLAPNLYEISEDILQRQIQFVLSFLKDAIDCADGFQNTHLSQQYESAKFSIEQVVFNLEKVRIMWEPFMATSTYRRCMHTLLDFVFSRITAEMLALDDIAAEETLQLQGLIHLALENMTSLFGSIATTVDEMIPSLRKLRKLADLFDMSLKSITSAWENGELLQCGFTSSEVESFIKAIFADSNLRMECLMQIEGFQNS